MFHKLALAATLAASLISAQSLPICAEGPVLSIVEATGCNIVDIGCICYSAYFRESLEPDVAVVCSPADLVTALQYFESLCEGAGVTVSFSTQGATIASATAAPIITIEPTVITIEPTDTNAPTVVTIVEPTDTNAPTDTSAPAHTSAHSRTSVSATTTAMLATGDGLTLLSGEYVTATPLPFILGYTTIGLVPGVSTLLDSSSTTTSISSTISSTEALPATPSAFRTTSAMVSPTSQSSSSDSTLSTVAKAGISIGSIFCAVAVIIMVLYCRISRSRRARPGKNDSNDTGPSPSNVTEIGEGLPFYEVNGIARPPELCGIPRAELEGTIPEA